MEGFFANNFARKYEKKKLGLVNETIVPATKGIILKIVGFFYQCLEYFGCITLKEERIKVYLSRRPILTDDHCYFRS